MKSIKANLTLRFNNMRNFDKEFHVALVNEIIKKGVKHLDALEVEVDEVRKYDVSYDFSK